MNEKQIEAIVSKCFNKLLKKEKEILKISLDRKKLEEEERRKKQYEREKEKTRKESRNTLFYFDLPLDINDFDNYFSDELSEIQELYKNFLNDLKKIVGND